MSSGTLLVADTAAGTKPTLTQYVKLRPSRRIYEAFTFKFISEFVFTNFTTPNPLTMQTPRSLQARTWRMLTAQWLLQHRRVYN